ncbi:MAG: hypothetical protein J7619_10265 [Dyadobacter sp.]|uniref:hypothetical protein n=1 Tax=Dyadobacter sp. TaxID=1914288 RepID=UPI001B2A82CE|nr:hypothetical protein [Dyadobacter sp.]MBO9613069.1 hypothetical protein [Dyadobacter sp.]
MKKSVQSSLVAAALLLSFTSLSANAQSVSQDSSRNARTQSFSGTVTYDGSGAGTGGSEGTYVGYNAGAVTTEAKNSFFGANSGPVNTTGKLNTFVGAYSGYSNTTASSNTFVGYHAGYTNTTGGFNTFVGNLSGKFNTTGFWNVALGLQAGYNNTTGNSNLFLGNNAGFSNTTGEANVALGINAGSGNITGNGNIFIGTAAGSAETGSNKLYIANSNTSNPLIKGDFSNGTLIFNGKVGVSTSTFPTTVGTADVSAYKLFVKGGILTEEVRIRTGWADYVFAPGYQLKDLASVEKYINKNGHLPNVPSAKTVEESGLSLGEIAKVQQEKIEELTLYLIEQNKKLQDLQQQFNEFKRTTERSTEKN